MEQLTVNAVKEYQGKAKKISCNGRQDVGEFRELRMEMQERYGITELQAINILNGYHAMDYVAIARKRAREKEEHHGAEEGRVHH